MREKKKKAEAVTNEGVYVRVSDQATKSHIHVYDIGMVQGKDPTKLVMPMDVLWGEW